MATTFNRGWDSLLTTTVDNYRPTMVDNIIKGTALTYWLTRRGKGQGLRHTVGGQFIQVPVVYQKNTNMQTISGYDRYNLAPTDEATPAFERWANCNTSCGISLDEMQANKGNSARANLLRMKVDVMETSAKEDWERLLVVGAPSSAKFTAGNGGKDTVPLGHIIQKDPTDSSTVHNINQNTESWWRNKTKLSASQAGSISFQVFRKEIDNVYNQCKKGSTNDGPDFGLTSQEVYEILEAGMSVYQRGDFYRDGESASMGFDSIRHKNMTIMWSEILGDYGAASGTTVLSTAPSATTGHIFFVNSKWLELVVDEEWDWNMTPFEKPIDQWAVWAAMLWRGNLTCLQRRKHGLLYAINTNQITV